MAPVAFTRPKGNHSVMSAQTSLQVFLNFNGCCEEALEHYRQNLGAEIEALVRMKDSPDPERMVHGADEMIWHASFRIAGTVVTASDCLCRGRANFEGFSLTLNVSSEEIAHKYFAALAEGGEVEMPLGKTPWSPCFGVVTDRFGVNWMISLAS